MVEFAPFLMVVAIVAIVCFTRLQRARLNPGDAGPGQGSVETDRLLGEVRQLKDRIAVLERIVTDGDRTRGLALEREIEALRDAREGAK